MRLFRTREAQATRREDGGRLPDPSTEGPATLQKIAETY